MHRWVLGVCAAVLAAALGGFAPSVSKTTSALPPGDPDDAVLERARLLASHGEANLALATLGRHAFAPGGGDPGLTASLLAGVGRPASAESLLAAAPATADGERFRNQLVRARLLLEAGRSLPALAVIARIDSIVSPYAAYRDLVAARAWIAAGEREKALAVLERARGYAPAAILDDVDDARMELYRGLDRPREALAAAVEAAGEGGDPAANRRLLKVRFDLALESGDTAIAAASARELFARHRRSPEALECARLVGDRRNAGRTDGDLLLACAGVLQIRGQRDALRSVLRSLDTRELTAPQAETHRLLWGEYHYLGGDYSRAIALARPSYSDPALRRRSMLLMARSYKKVGRNAEAAVTYEAYAHAFPNDAMAAEALYAAASLYGRIGEEGKHTRVLDELRHAYPSTFHGWAASVERAKALEAAGEAAAAAAIFDQWLTRSRRTDEAALYYSSQLRRRAGDVTGGDALLAELRAANPYSIYASPARLVLPPAAPHAIPAIPLDEWLVSASRRRSEAFERVHARLEPAGPASSAAAQALERGRFFLSVGLRDWAEGELDVARRESGDAPGEAVALARLFDEYAMPWRSVRMYERARANIPWNERRDLADDFRYLTHPVPYPVQVMSAAQREGIAPHMLYGMMREESCFDAGVVSRAGAVGLMQLMPGTARQVARTLDLDPGSGERLGDPVVNVSIGSWYAADLLREGEGSVVWMLAAYNAGPGAAGRWIEPGVAGEAAIDAVESIEYRETRGYVKRVVESANVYRALYFEGGSLPSSPGR